MITCIFICAGMNILLIRAFGAAELLNICYDLFLIRFCLRLTLPKQLYYEPGFEHLLCSNSCNLMYSFGVDVCILALILAIAIIVDSFTRELERQRTELNQLNLIGSPLFVFYPFLYKKGEYNLTWNNTCLTVNLFPYNFIHWVYKLLWLIIIFQLTLIITCRITYIRVIVLHGSVMCNCCYKLYCREFPTNFQVCNDNGNYKVDPSAVLAPW